MTRRRLRAGKGMPGRPKCRRDSTRAIGEPAHVRHARFQVPRRDTVKPACVLCPSHASDSARGMISVRISRLPSSSLDSGLAFPVSWTRSRTGAESRGAVGSASARSLNLAVTIAVTSRRTASRRIRAKPLPVSLRPRNSNNAVRCAPSSSRWRRPVFTGACGVEDLAEAQPRGGARVRRGAGGQALPGCFVVA